MQSMIHSIICKQWSVVVRAPLPSEVECAADVLMRLLLFLEVFLEFDESFLQVPVYLDVPSDYALHSPYVPIDVILHRAYTLHVRDKLTLFREQLGGLLEVLEVTVQQFLFLLDDPVNLLMEGKQFLWVDHLLAGAAAHSWLAKAALTVLALVG